MPRSQQPPAVGRRRVIAGLAYVASASLAGGIRAQGSASCVLTPESGEGPFYFDPNLVRVEIAESSMGAPLELGIRVVTFPSCEPAANARVDVWHADGFGFYSGFERQRGTGAQTRSPLGQTYLRGTQFTDQDGDVLFRTIYPSWYRGRTPHVHFKIFLGSDQVVASQIFFPDEINNEVFESVEPYRHNVRRRDTFNTNDSFLTDGRTGGVFCDVEQNVAGYRANLVVGVRAP